MIYFFLIWILMIKIVYQNDQCRYSRIPRSPDVQKNRTWDEHAIDSRLKLHHLTILGTHNSYHKETFFYRYSHPSLDAQLAAGIRQIELDIHIMDNNYLVYHLQFLDDQSNCYCFRECLETIRQWSERNGGHYPIFLFIEIKQQFYEDFLTALHGGVQCAHFKSMREQILQVLSPDSLILPELIRGEQGSLRDALNKQRQDELNGNYTYGNYGWPPLALARGKILVSFIDEDLNLVPGMISKCPPLSNFFFVAQTNVHLPYASIINIPNPLGHEQLVVDSQEHGLISRTLVGYGDEQLFDRYIQARRYGIHIISTDSGQCDHSDLCRSVKSDFHSASPILCNTVLAPSFCNITVSSL